MTVFNSCGEVKDSIVVSYLDAPDPFSLGRDTIICFGDELLLSSPSADYDILWQDGSVMLHYLVEYAGTYSLQLSNECGTVSDDILISIDSRIPVVTLVPELSWCPGDEFTLDAQQTFLATYLWSTGDMTPNIIVNVPGLYSVDVSTACKQASGQTELVQEDDCTTKQQFYIPNVFSPNGDGINDMFTIFPSSTTEVLSMEGSIYDRWGNLVHSSSENPYTWNGAFNNEPMMPGVYVYLVKLRYYADTGVVEEMFAGDITLKR